jgi:hypothetical protein
MTEATTYAYHVLSKFVSWSFSGRLEVLIGDVKALGSHSGF